VGREASLESERRGILGQVALDEIGQRALGCLLTRTAGTALEMSADLVMPRGRELAPLVVEKKGSGLLALHPVGHFA